MEEKEIRVRTADGEMPTFIVRPDGGGPFPVAVLYMDGVGYREQVKDMATTASRPTSSTAPVKA